MAEVSEYNPKTILVKSEPAEAAQCYPRTTIFFMANKMALRILLLTCCNVDSITSVVYGVFEYGVGGLVTQQILMLA